ncbi:MAG: M1 family metallopeptidase [Gammaproteobacteria bacterium]
MKRALCFIVLSLCSVSFSLACTAGTVPHVFGNPDVTQMAPKRAYHVDNYKLTLHFDEPKGEIFGDDEVTLRPLTAGFSHFYLDSSGLVIDSVGLAAQGGDLVPLSFKAQDPKLWISPNHVYGPEDRLVVHIRYHGFPRAGLYFVNPTADYPKWPREIWTQGEPDFNQHWFPSWDYPNDMSTSETITTVPDGQSVVSNGKLIKVTHQGGETTYDWVESIPHSAYLMSLAIGPWRKISDHEGSLPVDYYVSEGVSEATARRSFHLTPDMIGFFSRAFGVPYPYEKYAQVVVQNFIFGGQENVSATTLTSATLHDARADADYSSQALVAHELGQHWFGDMVQGRDWADIWLNEGFATYLEALYTQYHEGNEAFRFEIMNDQREAQRQDREDYRRPIVDDHYTDPMQMFDSITHEKGAVVLDMLRNILDGEQSASRTASQSEPLFKALKVYLDTYRAQAVDTADLIKTLQTATGRNLGWFFHEWVFMAGHPDYVVKAKYATAGKREEISITQTQPTNALTPLFDMPITLAFYGAHGESQRIQIRDTLRTQKFDIPLSFAPQWVDFDPDDVIDKTVQFAQPLAALIAKAERDPAMMSRLLAVQQLGAVKGSDMDAAVAALTRVLDGDTFYGVRCYAAASLGDIHTAQAKASLLVAMQQPDNRVRTAVVYALATFDQDRIVYAALVKALHHDRSYAVEAAAAEGLGKSEIPGAFTVLQTAAMKGAEIHVMAGIFTGLVVTGDPRAVPILLSYARSGVAERVRLDALRALSETSQPRAADNKSALDSVIRAALDDPFLSVQMAGESLVGVYHLDEFRADIQALEQSSPTIFQRDAAHEVLEQLH